jgi:hypothetical protein
MELHACRIQSAVEGLVTALANTSALDVAGAGEDDVRRLVFTEVLAASAGHFAIALGADPSVAVPDYCRDLTADLPGQPFFTAAADSSSSAGGGRNAFTSLSDTLRKAALRGVQPGADGAVPARRIQGGWHRAGCRGSRIQHRV